ncbi:DUF2577 domain-containing protein [Paenibacillus aceris]|uniref:DUF2577 domain-containing protein n=1 Tax=Paenibacillus aceris TaxID=869555 RepID=A0ABS4HRD5_9BACL|nr:DUF2577 domain-containing protein [Paenibacillus aceris]MBP1961167.1 hypothetical protein [Paenibacillus aceris]NHW35180.1 DUF2577 domain-containing protein [Paenibacillus aceris]
MKKIAELANLIKQAGVGAVDATSPVSVLLGTVTNTNPLEVSVDQRFSLVEDFLIIPEQLTHYEVTIGIQVVVIRRGLEIGDSLILLRMQGSQQYIILDRAV